MRKLKLLLLTAATVLLAACGGGNDNSIVAPSGGGGPGGPATVASLTLLTSSPQIPSDGSANATITALVRDNNNNVMKDVPVTFTANSGSLIVTQPATTDVNGLLTATLGTAGDPTNRAITVNALAGANTQSNVTVNVIGTAITITGPASLPLGASGPYTILVANAAGAGIANKSVSIASARANGIAPQTQLTTDAQGKAAFTLSANNSGNDTITVSALGIQATQTVAVSSDAFTFSAPAANTEVALGANVVVTTNWKQGSAAVANQPITFSATRGAISAPTVNTDASGNASITINANNAGPAVITATNSQGTSVQLNIEFVAVTPTQLELQANPFTVATNDQSTITAIVRDAAGNLVKNKTVTFVLDDTTGGTLSVAQATTNSQGRAQTFYNASATTSPVGGVHVNATVQGFPAVTDQVDLTVAQRAVFISLGTGNTIEEPNQSQYKKEWAIQVTDAQGNGVDLVNVSVSVLSEHYWDGIRTWGGKVWVTNPLPVAGCVDEDVLNRNGVLDPGEDLNGNGRLEAGNRVTAVARVGGGSTVTTDANGFALVDIYYAQDLAYWLEVTLEAKATVQGTEFRKAATFILEGASTDFSNETVAPPGVSSPFGVDGNCATPPPQ